MMKIPIPENESRGNQSYKSHRPRWNDRVRGSASEPHTRQTTRVTDARAEQRG